MSAGSRSTLRRGLRTLLLSAVLLNAGAVLGSLTLALLDERAHPPAGEFVTVHGRRLHYVRTEPVVRHEAMVRSEHDATKATTVAPGDRRDAPTLVLLHGGGTSSMDMQTSLLPQLAARGHAVIAFDRPGHGYSEAFAGDEAPPRQARLVRDALTALGVTDTVWIAHSRGAAIVLAAFLDDGALAPGSDPPLAGVLIAGVTVPSPEPPPSHVTLLQHELAGAWFAWTAIEYAGRLVMPTVLASAFQPETVPSGHIERTALALSLRPGTARRDALERTAVKAWLTGASDRGYHHLSAPLLVVHGTQDEVVPFVRHGLPLQTQVPTLALEMLSGAGHGLLHTRTRDVADAIDEFLKNGARGGT